MKSYAELKALIETCGVHEQLGPAGCGYGIEQNPHELATFLVRMQELGVQSVLEIGTGYKAGLARFLAHEMGWEVTTVDVKDYEHRIDGVQFVILLQDMPINFTEFVGLFDLVFIDGNHSYESVKHDYETYAQCATKTIAFHDIEGLRECQGARRFWWDMKAKYHNDPSVKMWWSVDDSDQCAGIGWIEL